MVMTMEKVCVYYCVHLIRNGKPQFMNIYAKAKYVRGREFEPKGHGFLLRRCNHTLGLVNRALHSTLPRRYETWASTSI